MLLKNKAGGTPCLSDPCTVRKEEEEGCLGSKNRYLLVWAAQGLHRRPWAFPSLQADPQSFGGFFIFSLLQGFEDPEFLGRFYF